MFTFVANAQRIKQQRLKGLVDCTRTFGGALFGTHRPRTRFDDVDEDLFSFDVAALGMDDFALRKNDLGRRLGTHMNHQRPTSQVKNLKKVDQRHAAQRGPKRALGCERSG